MDVAARIVAAVVATAMPTLALGAGAAGSSLAGFPTTREAAARTPERAVMAVRIAGDRIVLALDAAARPALALRFIGARDLHADEVADPGSTMQSDAAAGDDHRQRYADLYPGVDLDVYRAQGGVEYDLVVRAGADPRAIALAIEGADAIAIDDGGDLLIGTGAAIVRHAAPVAYQELARGRATVAAHYALDGNGRIRFAVGDYDRSRPLVLDPFIAASRLFGGTGSDGAGAYDRIEDLALGADGRLYAYGTISSSDFPGVDTAKAPNGGQGQVFVARIRPDTLAIDWIAIVGRRSADPASNLHYRRVDDDRVEGFAVGSDGTVYVAAYATSTRVPAPGEAYGSGAGAKYVFRIDGQGSVTPHAGPLDPAIRTIRALAVDAQGNVHFSGRATWALATTPAAAIAGAAVYASSNDPVRAAPYVVKLDAAGRTLVSTFLAVPYSRPANPNPEDCRNPADDETTAYALALGADGAIYAAGQARPEDMAATAGALDTGDAAFRDAFVAKLDPNGTALRFVARIGGLDNDRATGVRLAPDGSLAVVGKSLRSTWRVAAPGFQSAIAYQYLSGSGCEPAIPPEEGFLVSLAADGTRMLRRSLIGATGGDLDAGSPTGSEPMPLRLAVDPTGNVVVAGTTESGRTLPTQDPFVADVALGLDHDGKARPFVLKALADGNLGWGSRFGSRQGGGVVTGVAVDGAGNAFVAGSGYGPGFPVIHAGGPAGRDHYGYAFVTRVSDAPAPLTLAAVPSPARVGSPVALTARMFDASLSGAVEFRADGATVATVPLAGGAAVNSLPLPVGIHRLQAVVRGAGPWNGHATTDVWLVVEQTNATQ